MVDLPDEVTEVEIRIVDEGGMIVPAGRGMAHWLERGTRIGPDFMVDRGQPPLLGANSSKLDVASLHSRNLDP